MVALPYLLLSLLSAPVHARAGYDHNHPDVAWHTLETEHFRIHWPESKRPKDDPHWFTTEWTAGQTAQVAEAAWPRVCGQIGYYLEEPVHIVIYDNDTGWEGNGFALAEWDWIGLAAEWGSTYRQRGRAEFISDALIHELAHIVSLKAYLPWSEGTTGFQIGGLAEDEEWLQRWGMDPGVHTNFDIGFDAYTVAATPIWWTEGIAEFWSHRSGGNFWGSSRDAFLRMSALEDRLLTSDEWVTLWDKQGFDHERYYNQGYAFGLYLLERFGVDAYGQMAQLSNERWRWNWDSIVAEVTGVSTDQLWLDWRAWLDERFGAQVAAIKAQGPVNGGRELSLTEPPWEKTTPDEDWLKLSKKARDEAMDGKTSYQELPSYSPDGKVLAWFDRGLVLREISPEAWGAVGGTYLDEEKKADRKALKAYDHRTVRYDFLEYYRVSWAPDSTRFVATGHEDLAAPFLMDQGFMFDADGYNWRQLLVGTLVRDKKDLKVEWEAIPNTLRATEAAWSPDGQTIAFVRYNDGGHEVWTVAPDGSTPRQITHFNDGTQVQGISWTPDGQQLLVSLFLDLRQDLFLLSPTTGELQRLTDTKADETDPIVGPDGRLWFSSDTTGVLNVYSMDLATGTVEQQTNLVDGAYGVSLSPEGHLFYSAFTAHGFRVKAMPADALLKQPVDYPNAMTIEPYAVARVDVEPFPVPDDIFDTRAASHKYNALKSLYPLSGWPVARTTDRNVEVGAGFLFGDYTEGHYLEGEATFGKDNFLYLSYWLDTFWPSIMLGYMRYSYKGTYGYGVDEDGVVETTDDVTVVDLKFEQASDDIWAYFTYSPSYSIWGGFGADASQYSFRDTGNGAAFVPYTRHAGVGVFFEWNPKGWYYDGDQWINPRGGRKFYFDYQYRMTALVDPEIAGAVYDDGELMDQYGYHQIAATWTEYVPVTWFGLVDRHALQLDFELGWIDRNVMAWDEFMAGGRHPYHWGSGTIGNNVQFSGYEGWSLSGETMLIANAAYRFPIARDLNFRLGPTYTEAVYLQFFGSFGNLWSYRTDGPTHIEGWSVVADDPNDIRREVPGKDYAYKNSPADNLNYWLTDAGVELRVRSFIWNDYDWDSFLRLAYGFNATGGYGDVNYDLIMSSLARDSASELSDEVEPPTLRIYAGIGTGW